MTGQQQRRIGALLFLIARAYGQQLAIANAHLVTNDCVSFDAAGGIPACCHFTSLHPRFVALPETFDR